MEVISRNFFIILKVPSLANYTNFSVALSPWHQNSCLKHDGFTQDTSFLGLASVTYLLSFFLTYQRWGVCCNEFIGKITWESKTCLISLLKYHIDYYYKLWTFIITIIMLASKRKKKENKNGVNWQDLLRAFPGVPVPCLYGSHAMRNVT